ncbi:MAG TPA: serine hydrolase [bacterium]
MRRGVRAALLGAAAAAVFAAGFGVGRRSVPRGPATGADSYEIRAGGHSYTNPLLECEVGGERLYRAIRPFGAGLEKLAPTLAGEGRVDDVAVYFRDLNNGAWIGWHEQQQFVPASLAKLPIVLAAFLQADADPAFLARTIVYQGGPAEADPDFANPESNLERGRVYTVDELIRRIARFSDNASANLLAGVLPPGLLARVYADLGIDPERAASGTVSLSPKEYGAFFRVLYNASYLSRGNSERALRYLDDSTFELGLVAGVPAGVHVSHKFGVWEEARGGGAAPLQLHDCGIVYHPNRPYLLCVMTTGANYVRMATAIEAVSRFVWQEVENDLERPGLGPPTGGG